MVNNQTDFNNKYPKETKEIKLKRKVFHGELIIEDYLELKKIDLREIKSIKKLTFKNLEKLNECEIWGCGMEELVIVNCPEIKILNVRTNCLKKLDFLLYLENLEKLELEGNDKLIEILKPYKNDWKSYQKDFREIFELTKQGNFQGLAKKFWDLKKSREDLKKKISTLIFKEAQQETTSKEISTKELVSNLEKQLAQAKIIAQKREKEIDNISKSEIVIQTPIYKEAINFLRAKSIFLNARRGTIEELKERCNELEKFLKDKSAKFSIIGDALSNTGEATSSTQIYGVIPKALGEVIKAGNEYSKIKFLAKSSEEFQILLKNEDELTKVDNIYNSLINLSNTNVLKLKEKEVYGKKHLFNIDCEISAILESKGIWKGKLLNSEAMETAIMSLSENLKVLEEEWNNQFSEFKNKLRLGKEYTYFFIQEKEIREQIQQLQNQLDKLINSAKSRLESKKWWNVSEDKEKKTKDRQLFLENFLKNNTSLTNSEKELLEKKLTKEGLDILYQKKKELTELKKIWTNLLEQEPQLIIQLSPKS